MPEPVIEPVVEPVVELVDAVTGEPVVDVLEPAVELEPTPEPKAPLPKWMLDRIAEAQRNEQAARQDAQKERDGRTNAEALAARLQKGETAPAPAPPQVDMALVNQAANKQLMDQARQQIIKDGYAAFGGPKFDEMASILGAVGCVNDEFVADVLAVDRPNAHKTLAALAAEPETAARLASLDSRSRIAELTRITMAKAAVVEPVVVKVAPKVVSKAPAPAPVVEPSASKVTDWRADETSDEDFTKGFEETMKKRSGRR